MSRTGMSIRSISESFRYAWQRTGLDARPERRDPILFIVALVLVVIAAAAIRMMRAHWGLPYVHTWDEPQTADAALRILKSGSWNPHFFTYGSVVIYLYVFVDILHFLFLMGQPEVSGTFLTGLDDIRTHFESGWLWTISHPTFYLWNRYVMAVAGALTVAVTYKLGRKLAGPWAGLLAALLLGGLAVHVRHSALLTPDVMVALIVAGSTLAAILFLEKERPGYLLASMALAGLAASTKYNAAIALLTPAAALVISAVTRGRGYRGWLWAALAVVPAICFLAGTPYAILDFRAFLDSAGKEMRVYHIHGSVGNRVDRVEPGLAHFVLQLRNIAANLGVAGTFMVLASPVLILSRRIGWLWIPFPLVYLQFMSGSRVPFERNFMVLYPFVAAAFGAGAVLVFRWGNELLGGNRQAGRVFRTAMAGVLLILLGQSWIGEARGAMQALGGIETRTLSMRMLDDLMKDHEGARAGIAEELRIHPMDLAGLDAAYEVRSLAELICRWDRYAYLAAGTTHKAYSRIFDPVAEGLNALKLREMDSVAGEVAGELLHVDILSTNPGVLLLEGGSAGEDGGGCVAAVAPGDLSAAKSYYVDGEGYLYVTDGGVVTSPGFFLDPGRYTFFWRAWGTRAAGSYPRLRATVSRPTGEDDKPMAEAVVTTGPFSKEFALSFMLSEEAFVILKLDFVNDYFDEGTGADRNVALGGVTLLKAR